MLKKNREDDYFPVKNVQKARLLHGKCLFLNI